MSIMSGFNRPYLRYMIVLLVLFMAVWLRFYHVGTWLRFTGDEARDALAAYDIVRGGDLPTLGPKIHIGFGHLGPAYYYLLAIPLYLFDGNPAAAGWLTAVFDIAAIGLVFIVGRTLFQSRTGLLAALLYAFSFNIIFYARWGWHPSLLPLFTLLVIQGSLAVSNGRVHHLPKVTFCLALAAQFHMTAVLLFVPLLAALWPVRHHLSRRLMLTAAATALYPFLPVIWHEIQYGFPNLIGLFNFAGHKTTEGFSSPFLYLLNSLQSVATWEVAHKGIPLLADGGLIRWLNLALVGGGAVVLGWKRPFPPHHRPIFLSWALLPPLVMALFPGDRPDYYLLLWFPVPLLLVALLINQLWLSRQAWRLAATAVLLGLLVLNLTASVRYFHYLSNLDTTYSYYHSTPLGQKQDIAAAISTEVGLQAYNVALVTWSWPNHIPYAYLLQENPAPLQTMVLFEATAGTSTPYQVHWLDTAGTASHLQPYANQQTFIIKEPDSLPMPAQFKETVHIDTIGAVGIYKVVNVEEPMFSYEGSVQIERLKDASSSPRK